MHALLKGRHEGETTDSQTGAELRPTLSAAQPVTARSPSVAQSPWTAPSYWQHRLPPTGSVNPTPSPHAVPPEVRNSAPQRKLGNRVCGALRSQAENFRALSRKRRAPEAMHPGQWSPQRANPFALAQLEATASNPAKVV